MKVKTDSKKVQAHNNNYTQPRNCSFGLLRISGLPV